MSGAFPALGFDPAPGDLMVAEDLCAAVQRALHTLVLVRVALDAFGDPGAVWRGEAARAFAGELTELSPYLVRAEESHLRAYRALTSWAQDLARRQAVARGLEQQAEAAQRCLVVAGLAAERAAERALLPCAAGVVAEQALQAAAWEGQRRLREAEQELADLRARAQRLLAEHRAEADHTGLAVRAAADHAPPEPGVLDRVASTLTAAVRLPTAARQRAWQLCTDNAHTIGEVADVLADASVALGVAALVVAALPVAAAATPFALAAAGLGALTLGVRGLSDAAGANVPATTYALDGVAVAAGAVGAAAGLGVRTARAVLAGSVTTAHAADAAALSGSAVGTVLGVVQNSHDDRPFMHFVPDDATEMATFAVLGPGATAFLSALELGRAKDRAAAAEAERSRWMR